MSQRYNISCQDSHTMNVARDARDMVALAAGPRHWNDTRESWLAKAARALGFSYQRTRSIFYCRARVISAEEWIRLTEEFANLKKSAAERQELLRDVDLLARSAAAARGEDSRPLGVERGEASGARPGQHDKARGRPIR